MVKEKELIERRGILPLAQPQLAERLGLVPPRAIVLGFPPSGGTPTPVTAVLVAEGEDEQRQVTQVGQGLWSLVRGGRSA